MIESKTSQYDSFGQNLPWTKPVELQKCIVFFLSQHFLWRTYTSHVQFINTPITISKWIELLDHVYSYKKIVFFTLFIKINRLSKKPSKFSMQILFSHMNQMLFVIAMLLSLTRHNFPTDRSRFLEERQCENALVCLWWEWNVCNTWCVSFNLQGKKICVNSVNERQRNQTNKF